MGDGNSISSDSIIRGSFNSVNESTFIIGDNNTVPEGATNVMIVGNGITASATGGILYADNLQITNNGTINGIPVSSVISGDLFWSAGTAAQSIKQKDTLASATGIRSFSVGQGIGINGSIASGQDSIAFAGGNASGLRSFAHGIAAAAIGQDSVAFTAGSAPGLNSFSHAGYASGILSSSLSGGSAVGDQSHAAGDGALAQTYSETVVGINASSITGNSGAYSASDPAFRVGNGTSNVTRSDAFRVYKNGAAYLKPITTASVTSPVTGMIVFDSVSNSLVVWNGTTWVTATGAPSVKTYRARVNGSTVTVFENTLGTITFSSFSNEGTSGTSLRREQTITGTGLFTTNKTFISATSYESGISNIFPSFLAIESTSVNNIVTTFYNADFTNTSEMPYMLEIIVYP